MHLIRLLLLIPLLLAAARSPEYPYINIKGKKKVLYTPRNEVLVMDEFKANNNTPGFFFVFLSVVGMLDYVDKGLCGGLMVNFGKRGLYYSPAHGPNWWEYYFEPLKILTPPSGILKPVANQQKYYFGYHAGQNLSTARSYELLERYVRLRPTILAKRDAFVQQHLEGRYVIGLHYRGTDKKSESVRISYTNTFAEVEKAIKAHGKEDWCVYVATDEAPLFAQAKIRYGDRVFGLDAIRSENDQPIHFTPSDHYRKGEEALLDCLLLASSHHLIRTGSCLSQVSACFNPHIPVVYLPSLYPTPLHNQN